MKITAVSDLHSRLSILKDFKMNKVNGDIFICSGDLTRLGTKDEADKILEYISVLDFKYKIIVFGNHDMFAEKHIDYFKDKYTDIIFLNNEIVEVEGLKIYGTPYVRAFCNWGFQYYTIDERKDLTIPKEDVDIIIAHEPPSELSISYLPYGQDIGNMALRSYIESSDNVKYVFCGHVHENGGREVVINKAKCFNVACTFKHLEI